MEAVEKQITLEEFLKLPEEKPALEFEGELVSQKVTPKGKHSVLQREVTRILDSFARESKLGRAFPELRTTYSGRSYVPDVSVYRWHRIPVDAMGQVADVFPEPPDIAVEIVSPEQSVNAPVRRSVWSVEHGVRVALLVDPADQSVLVFLPDRSPQVLRGSEQVEFPEVLPGLRLTVAELFDALRME